MSLHPFKSAIVVKRGVLLGHIVSEEGMSVNSTIIEVIRKATLSSNLKEISKIFGQIKRHNRHLMYLSNGCAPLSHLTKKGIDFVCSTTRKIIFDFEKDDGGCSCVAAS